MKPIQIFLSLAFGGGQLLLSPAWAQALPAMSPPPAFADGCPALGALQYMCLPPRIGSAAPAKEATAAEAGTGEAAELLKQLLLSDGNEAAPGGHTPRQAQQAALALVEGLQGAWARLPPHQVLSGLPKRGAAPPPASVATRNTQMLAVAMVGNALALNPCLDLDTRRAAAAHGERRVGTTTSVCDPAIQAVSGIGVAKLNMAFYQKQPGAPAHYTFPYYQEFYEGLNNWTGDQYRAGSFLDSVLYLGALFTSLQTPGPLHFLKTPVNRLEVPFRPASPVSKTMLPSAAPLDDSKLDYAVDAFAAFQVIGVGQCLASSSAGAGKDPCSHQCRVNAANRVLGWVRQQKEGRPCVEPVPAPKDPAPAPSMML